MIGSDISMFTAVVDYDCVTAIHALLLHIYTYISVSFGLTFGSLLSGHCHSFAVIGSDFRSEFCHSFTAILLFLSWPEYTTDEEIRVASKGNTRPVVTNEGNI